MSETLQEFMERIEQRNPHEKEYLQAVHEVAEIIIPFMDDHPEYRDANILERIAEPDRVIMFRVPWTDDSGRFRMNRGFRVQMSNSVGPYKGGLRFHPSVNLSVLKFLAFEQVFKNALTTLSLGGAKGGSDFDPKGKSDNEIMNFCQNFMNELSKYIGSEIDVPAGDIGVGSREIGYLFGQYKRLSREFDGVITGKGLSFGGSRIRPEATGYGVCYFVKEMLERKGEDLEGKRIAISGSGNVAIYAIEKAIDLGAVPVTASDSDGAVHDPDGINTDKLEYLKTLKFEEKGRIKAYADEFGCDYFEGGNPWQAPCDIALPCATQNELSGSDAETLLKNGCMLVAEGANMPCTPEAIDVLRKQDIMYAPGKASNAGGVATSGLEMAQNAMHTSWSRSEVDAKLKEIMKNIHNCCVHYGGQANSNVDYGKGANIAGFVRVADAMLAEGNI